MGAADTENRLEPFFGMRSNEILIIHEEIRRGCAISCKRGLY